jgi:hypothetical protein
MGECAIDNFKSAESYRIAMGGQPITRNVPDHLFRLVAKPIYRLADLQTSKGQISHGIISDYNGLSIN